MSASRALIALLFLAACSESSFTSAGPLRITSVDPKVVSARGGVTVTVDGAGFDDDTQITVRGVPAKVVSVAPTRLTITMPQLSAGSAEVHAERVGDEATLANALTVQPLSLAFAQESPWLVPTLPGTPRALVPFDADADHADELLVGTDAGLVLVTSNKGVFEANPIHLAASGAEPGVRAVAVDRATGTAALCSAEDAAPIRLVRAAAGGAAPVEGGIDGAKACSRIVFLRAAAGEPAWLVAQTAAGLAAWRSEDGKFVPRETPFPSLPGEITALLPADLDGDGTEELLVAGRSDAGAWLRVVDDSDTARAPFPPPRAVVYGLAALDATGDGNLDVYAAGPGQDGLFVGDGHGEFFDDTWRLLPFERAEGRAVAAADLDLDGHTDLVVATNDGPDRLFVADGGAFTDRTPLLGLDAPYGSQAIALVDLDRDGDLDVITATVQGLRMRLFVEATP